MAVERPVDGDLVVVGGQIATPKDIQARLRSETVKIIKSPGFRQRLADIGADPIGDGPEQMAQTIKAETEKFGKLVKDANVTIE